MQRGHRIGLVAIALLIAVAAVLLIGQEETDDDAEPVVTTEQTRPAEEPTATVRAPKPPRIETIRIADGKPAGGVRKLEFERGDTVRIEVRSDTAGQIHVHGYDIRNDVTAGGQIRFAFKARAEGIYEIEIEETHTPLAELVVEP